MIQNPASHYPAPVAKQAADQLNPQDLELVDGIPGMLSDDDLLFFSPSLTACFIAKLGYQTTEEDDDTTLQGPLDAQGVCHFWGSTEVMGYLAEIHNGREGAFFANPLTMLNVGPEEALLLWEAFFAEQGSIPVWTPRVTVGDGDDDELPF